MYSIAEYLRYVAAKTDEESVAQGVYMKFTQAPEGKRHYQMVLQKYPKYNENRKEAEKATAEIMAEIKKRLKIKDKSLDPQKLMQSIETKVLEGIT
jgi:hypothetical protein